jgi:sugar phosphate isomerase/epimerase
MTEAKVGLSMLYCLGEPFRKMTEQIPKAGTTYIELVDDGLHELTKQRVTLLMEISNSHGTRYSVHAPFADVNIASPSQLLLKAMLKRLEQSIANARTLEAYMWVFHPGIKTGISMFYPGADWLQNLKTANALARIAKKYGVKVAIENVPEPHPFLIKSAEDLERFFAEADERIGLALDVGHSNLNGQTELFLKTFRDRIVHMHVSDNDGKNDQHLGIGDGTVQWNRLAELVNQAFDDKVIVVESVEHAKESVDRLRGFLCCKRP